MNIQLLHTPKQSCDSTCKNYGRSLSVTVPDHHNIVKEEYIEAFINLILVPIFAFCKWAVAIVDSENNHVSFCALRVHCDMNYMLLFLASLTFHLFCYFGKKSRLWFVFIPVCKPTWDCMTYLVHHFNGTELCWVPLTCDRSVLCSMVHMFCTDIHFNWWCLM